MSNFVTSTASEVNMDLSDKRYFSVPTKWLKKRSSKAERAEARNMTSMDNVHAELLEDAELRAALGNDQYEGSAFVYGRDFSWR